MITLLTIISLAASKGWKLWQLDVKNVFFYGELDRHYIDSNKLLMLGLVRLLNILIFVVLSLHVLIRAYLLRKQQLDAPCSYFMLII